MRRGGGRRRRALRLRPILMTTGAMVLGALPLALATGAGAESRQQIGWVIVGGMSLGTLLTIFVVPTMYMLFARKAVPGEISCPSRARGAGPRRRLSGSPGAAGQRWQRQWRRPHCSRAPARTGPIVMPSLRIVCCRPAGLRRSARGRAAIVLEQARPVASPLATASSAKATKPTRCSSWRAGASPSPSAGSGRNTCCTRWAPVTLRRDGADGPAPRSASVRAVDDCRALDLAPAICWRFERDVAQFALGR